MPETMLVLTGDATGAKRAIAEAQAAEQARLEAAAAGRRVEEDGGRAVAQQIQDRIRAIEAMGRALNTQSATAVRAYLAEAEATREWGQQIGLTTEQTQRLEASIRSTERRIEATSHRFVSGAATAVQGLASVAEQGELAGNAVESIASGAESIAFMFGPQGIVVGAVIAAGAAIYHLVSTSKQDIQDEAAAGKKAVEDLEKLAPRAELHRAQSMRDDAMRKIQPQLDALDRQIAEAEHSTALGAAQHLNDLENQRLVLLGSIRDQLDAADRLEESGRRRARAADRQLTLQTQMADIQREHAAILSLEAARRQAMAAHQTAAARELGAQIADQNALLASQEDQIRRNWGAGSDAVQALNLEDRTYQLAVQAAAAAERQERARARDVQHLHEEIALLAAIDKALGPALAAANEAVRHEIQSARGASSIDPSRIAAGAQAEINAGAAADQGRQARSAADTDHLATSMLHLVNSGAAAHDVLRVLRDDMESLGDSSALTAKGMLTVSAVSQVGFHAMQAASTSAVHALVTGQGSAIKALKAAAAEPIVTYLEGLAVKAIWAGAADALEFNFAGAAGWAAVAAGSIAAAREVARLGGVASSGGGGGGGGGGGATSASRSAGAGAFGGHALSQLQPVQIEILVVHETPSGRTVDRYRQQMQRMHDRNVPLRLTV